MTLHRPYRRGSTLIELLVVISATTAILATVAMLLHLVLRMDTDAHKRAYLVTSLGRIAQQFRCDVHQAVKEPTISADRREMELQLPGGSNISWRIEAAGFVRSENKNKDKNAPARESSYACANITAQFELEPQGPAKIACLRIDATGDRLLLSIDAMAIQEEKP